MFSSSFPSSPCFRCIFSVLFLVVSCHTTEIGVSERAQQVTTENRTRINSRYLRELTLGKFIVQYEHLTQMDNIGQGTTTLNVHMHISDPCYRVIDNSSGEFGIVYKARLASPHGRSGREVAVKTLKGKFNYRVCVGSVMCKVIPWS